MTLAQSDLTIARWIDALRTQPTLYELVHGELVAQEKSMLSSWVATQIAYLLKGYAEKKGLGYAATEVPLDIFRFFRNHGRKPDVVYYSRQSLPNGIPDQVPMTVVPDLVVEVVSPSNDYFEVDQKIQEYLRAGVKLVWIVNPEQKLVHIYRGDGTTALLNATQRLDGEAIIPGLNVAVAEFFPSA